MDRLMIVPAVHEDLYKARRPASTNRGGQTPLFFDAAPTAEGQMGMDLEAPGMSEVHKPDVQEAPEPTSVPEPPEQDAGPQEQHRPLHDMTYHEFHSAYSNNDHPDHPGVRQAFIENHKKYGEHVSANDAQGGLSLQGSAGGRVWGDALDDAVSHGVELRPGVKADHDALRSKKMLPSTERYRDAYSPPPKSETPKRAQHIEKDEGGEDLPHVYRSPNRPWSGLVNQSDLDEHGVEKYHWSDDSEGVAGKKLHTSHPLPEQMVQQLGLHDATKKDPWGGHVGQRRIDALRHITNPSASKEQIHNAELELKYRKSSPDNPAMSPEYIKKLHNAREELGRGYALDEDLARDLPGLVEHVGKLRKYGHAPMENEEPDQWRSRTGRDKQPAPAAPAVPATTAPAPEKPTPAPQHPSEGTRHYSGGEHKLWVQPGKSGGHELWGSEGDQTGHISTHDTKQDAHGMMDKLAGKLGLKLQGAAASNGPEFYAADAHPMDAQNPRDHVPMHYVLGPGHEAHAHIVGGNAARTGRSHFDSDGKEIHEVELPNGDKHWIPKRISQDYVTQGPMAERVQKKASPAAKPAPAPAVPAEKPAPETPAPAPRKKPPTAAEMKGQTTMEFSLAPQISLLKATDGDGEPWVARGVGPKAYSAPGEDQWRSPGAPPGAYAERPGRGQRVGDLLSGAHDLSLHSMRGHRAVEAEIGRRNISAPPELNRVYHRMDGMSLKDHSDHIEHHRNQLQRLKSDLDVFGRNEDHAQALQGHIDEHSNQANIAFTKPPASMDDHELKAEHARLLGMHRRREAGPGIAVGAHDPYERSRAISTLHQEASRRGVELSMQHEDPAQLVPPKPANAPAPASNLVIGKPGKQGQTAMEFSATRGNLSKSFSDGDVSRANKTSRAAGAIGANAVVPKYIRETTPQGESILDFGAGHSAQHALALRRDGHDVTAHEFGGNMVHGVHDPGALGRKYDHVYASNVLNVQSSRPMLSRTLDQIAGAVKPGGRAVMNFPESPRHGDFDHEHLQNELEQRFSGGVSRVGGSRKAPVFEARAAGADLEKASAGMPSGRNNMRQFQTAGLNDWSHSMKGMSPDEHDAHLGSHERELDRMKQMGTGGPGFARRMGALEAHVADHNRAIGR